MNKYAVIVAGGKGLRMGANLPKQFMMLEGKPILFYSVIAFMETFPDLEVILVLPAEFSELFKDVVAVLPDSERITIVKGGETRFHSVQNGLRAVKGNGVVFVHDGARPLVSPTLLRRCLESATKHGSAIPVVPVAESIRQITAKGSLPVNRDELRVVQTPQTFRTELILKAFAQEYDPAFTDEATVAEAAGIPVQLVEGDKRNIKITTPEDMAIATVYLRQGVR